MRVAPSRTKNNIKVHLASHSGKDAAFSLMISKKRSLYSRQECAAIHLLEHLILGAGSREHEVKRDLGEPGSMLNGSAGSSFAEFYFTCKQEEIIEKIGLFAKYYHDLNFSEEDFLHEKRIILDELEDARDNAQAFISEAVYGEELDDLTRLNRTQDGLDIEDLTLEDLELGRRNLRDASQVSIAVACTEKSESVVEALNQHFGDLVIDTLPDEEEHIPDFSRPRLEVIPHNANRTTLALSHLYRSRESYDVRVVLLLLDAMLTNESTGILFKDFRKTNYSIESSISEWAKDIYDYEVSVSIDASTLFDSLFRLMRHLYAIPDQIDDKKLEEAATIIQKGFREAMHDPLEALSYIQNNVVERDITEPFELEEYHAGIVDKVTLDNVVNEVKNIRPDNLICTISGKVLQDNILNLPSFFNDLGMEIHLSETTKSIIRANQPIWKRIIPTK